MKVINDLLGFNLKIVQDTSYFNFSLDSVLLYNFLNIKSNYKILDLCSRNCPIPLMLSSKTNNKIYAVELQKEIYNLGKESIDINNLNDKIILLNEDAKNIDKLFDTDSFDLITCNPPYFEVNKNSKLNKNDIKSVARHEICINLEDIMKISKKLLKNNSSLVLVHRTERLSDVINLMIKYNISPKRIQFIYPKVNKNSNLFIIEGTKNGNNKLKVLSPLIIHNQNGEYKENIKKIFNNK